MRIVENGRQRMRNGLLAEIRMEIELQYAEELATAGVVGRWRLRRRIHRLALREMKVRARQVSARALF
jgi:hypothetical protein